MPPSPDARGRRSSGPAAHPKVPRMTALWDRSGRPRRAAGHRCPPVRPLRGFGTALPLHGADLSGVGVSGPTRAKRGPAVCEGVPAAVATVGAGGSVERATRGFVDLFELRRGSLEP